MSPDMRWVCGWRLGDDICIDDEWHGGAHIMVPVEEVEAA